MDWAISLASPSAPPSFAPRPSAPRLAAPVAPVSARQRSACCAGGLLVAAACRRERRDRVARRADVKITDATGEKRVEDFCKKGARVEVLAPSNRWREAQVVRVGGGVARIHYTGYDAQFDEEVALDNQRLRPFGQIRSEKLKERKENFVLQMDAGCCPGCGVKLQCTDKMALGYVPPDKFVKQEEEDLSMPLNAEDEVALLLKEDGAQERDSFSLPTRSDQKFFKVIANVYLDIRKAPDVNAERTGESLVFGQQFQIDEVYRSADSRNYFRLADGRGWVFDRSVVKGAMTQLVAPVGDDLGQLKRAGKEARPSVCMRCWGLWHYNDCDDVLRPAYGGAGASAGSSAQELTAEAFEKLLSDTLRPAQEATIFAVVDVFDFGPSFKLLQYLAQELVKKPKIWVRIIANKIDLLPKDASMPRVKGWIAREAQLAGLDKIKIMDVFPISCHQGKGLKPVSDLLETKGIPEDHYVVGAANAGKSSFLNRLTLRKRRGVGRVLSEDQSGFVVSVLPGTTLRPIAMKFQQTNIKLIDMPGLLVPGSIAEKLTLEDLKEIMPQKRGSVRLTFHMDEGRSLLLGALARLDFVSGRPYQFTVFVSENVKLHRTRIEKASRICQEWAGDKLKPPVDARRYQELLPWKSTRFELTGTGWDESCVDIVFPGLGWVAITGCGDCVVEAHAPEGVEVTQREPLMPYEAKWTGVKYRGFPGWYKIKGRSTRGFESGKKRYNIKGRF